MEVPLDTQTDCLELHFLELVCPPRQRKQSFTDLMPASSDALPFFESLYDSLNAGLALHSLIAPSLDSEDSMQTIPDGEVVLELPKKPSRPKAPRTHVVRTAVIAPPQKPKMIGTLTAEQRRARISRFLEKRKRRVWTKKISYDCRKRVADNRLRVKGRFVTKTQAVAALGPELVAKWTESEGS